MVAGRRAVYFFGVMAAGWWERQKNGGSGGGRRGSNHEMEGRGGEGRMTGIGPSVADSADPLNFSLRPAPQHPRRAGFDLSSPVVIFQNVVSLAKVSCVDARTQ